MVPTARTVRRLRLRAPSEAAVRRASRVLEDALRIATLPDAGGRMLFVRRLALGRLAGDAQPVTVALALEEALARVGVEWRHGADPGAPASLAVWFRDPLEAHTTLALRLLAGYRPEAWFWPLAVQGWDRGMTRGEGVRAIANSLAARAEAPTALPRWFGELLEGGFGGALAAALRAEDVEPMARAAGVRLGRSLRVRGVEEGMGGERREVLRLQSASAELDAVHRLIAAMAEKMGSGGTDRHAPSFRYDPSQPGDRLIETAPSERPAPAAEPSDIALEVHRRGEVHGKSGPTDFQGMLWPSEGPGDVVGVAGEGSGGEGPVWEGRAPVAEVSAQQRCSPPRVLTGSTGGLLFMLNALERVGYGEWLTYQPEWESQDVARRVLARVLERLDAPAEDPAWEVVRVPASLPDPPLRFVAPPRWRDGLLTGGGPLLHAVAGGRERLTDPSGRLLLGGWCGPCPRSLLRDRRGAARSPRVPGDLGDEVVGAWDGALRRWLRRFAGVSVRDLVVRPASIVVSPTHLDVHLDLATAEPRIRRAGLDLDPGWVRWFGRVVAFHYDFRGCS